MKLKFTLLSLVINCYCLSQNIQWDANYGGTGNEGGYCIRQATDGGFVLTGYTNSQTGNNGVDVYLLKTDQSGTETWSGNTNGLFGPYTDYGVDIELTNDGGYIVAGVTSVLESTPIGNAVLQDAGLFKFNDLGGLIWQRAYRAQYDVNDEANAVEQRVDGGYVICGRSDTSFIATGWSFLYVIYTDQLGFTNWDSTYAFGSHTAGNDISVDDLGNIFITGEYRKDALSGSRAFVCKIDNQGNLIWTNTFPNDTYSKAFTIHRLSDGSMIIGGIIAEAGISDYFLRKLDANGNEIWEQTYGDNNLTENFGDFYPTTDGGFIITGDRILTGDHDTWLVKTNSNGSPIWDMSLGTGSAATDGSRSVRQTSDGGYILCGTVTTTNAEQACLIKIGDITGLLEETNSKPEGNIIRTIDFQGRDISLQTTNTVIINVYDNGSIKKTMIVE